MNKWKSACGLLLAAALVATGCGGGKSGNESSPSASQAASQAAGAESGTVQEFTVKATNFAFEPQEIKVKQGDTVKITLNNAQGNHGLQIEGYDKEVKGDQTITFTADKTGEFKFVCSIMCGAGHADMVGKLIVE